jgi:glutamate carboxypeptidase
MDPRHEPAKLLPLASGRMDDYLVTLAAAVNTDSGSGDAAGVRRMADLVARRLAGGGWQVERRLAPDTLERPVGDLVLGRKLGDRPARDGGRRLLLLAHMDTVFSAGAAAERPFRTLGDRAYGPGVIDDKSGLLMGIEAVELLTADAGFADFAEITLLCSPDEEIGAPFTRPLIRDLAGEADVALGLEAARRNGDLVSARKGLNCFAVDITGVAAHAGVAPERGRNAALEAAHKTVALQALNGRWPGVTCNVGVVRAGTKPNVVADAATLEVDLRATTVAEFEEASAAVDEIVTRSQVPGTAALVRPLHAHVPMERTPATAALVATAQAVAAELGFELADQATGGCGDANIAASTGTPTVDGLGPKGGDAHSPEEFLEISSVVPRMALLAGFLAHLGSGSGADGKG